MVRRTFLLAGLLLVAAAAALWPYLGQSLLPSLKIGGLALVGLATTLMLTPVVMFYLLLDGHSILTKLDGDARGGAAIFETHNHGFKRLDAASARADWRT